MATINFAEVPLDNYVYIDDSAQKEIKIDGVVAYSAPKRYYYYTSSITADTKVEMEYKVFTGSSYTTAKTTDSGSTSTHINGGASYPCGGLPLELRIDEDYFLYMKNGSASQSANGRDYLDIGDITLKFNRKYKAIDSWIMAYVGSASGLNTFEVEVIFGDKSVSVDLLKDRLDDRVFLQPTEPSDTITFSFNIYGSTTATRKFDGLNILVEDITGYY